MNYQSFPAQRAAKGEGQGQARLGPGRIASYGAGDFAFNLSFAFSSLFLLYFYTDVLGLSAKTAGLIMMAALIWDGIADPIIGAIANRTRTRWGRYRPYMLFGAVPLGLAVVAMFLPLNLSGAALAAYALASQVLYRTVFATVNIPYIALSARLTLDSDTRGRLAGARMLFAIGCGVAMAALTLPLVKAFGGGQAGFLAVSIVYSTLAAAVLIFCFLRTQETVEEDPHDSPDLGLLLKSLWVNKPFLLLLPATILGSTAYTMSGKALVYYLKYWGGSEAMVTLGLVTTLGLAALSLPVWMTLSRRLDKRTTWLLGVAINVAAYLGVYLLAPRQGPLLWALLAATGVGNGAFVLTFWSMLPDTVEYGEWKTGIRSEGAIFGLISFAQKVALGVGTGSIGLLLDQFGYVANAAQSASTLHGIVAMYGLGPALLFAASAAAIWFYPIDAATHGRLVRAIQWRRVRRSGRVSHNNQKPH
ncbi:MFS transporter [Caulobacter rhizosphaerae]|uniref:MFS transporter n=1 Tax=Caulobacter rhizosphaerae TaxID=2010972 RepID=UPI0013D7F1AB|nr:MFS transporter [Caulobacter rhizosphaerae]GGL35084.1 sugar transporter [Caulobacter rhizosphaerae]